MYSGCTHVAKGCGCVPSQCSQWETLVLSPWHPSCTPGPLWLLSVPHTRTSEGRGSVSLFQSLFSSFSCFSAHLNPVELAIPAIPGALQDSPVANHGVVLFCRVALRDVGPLWFLLCSPNHQHSKHFLILEFVWKCPAGSKGFQGRWAQ